MPSKSTTLSQTLKKSYDSDCRSYCDRSTLPSDEPQFIDHPSESIKLAAKPHRVIVFSRYPEPGVTKTRMIPALGAERAARLQQSLTKLTLGVTSDYRAGHPCDLEVRFAGGDATQMRKVFGPDKRYRPQQCLSLGDRLTDAFAVAFDEGATLVNQLCIAGFCCGIHPKTLYRWYRQ